MPATILETLQKAVAFLEKKGVPQARLSAEWLFAEALGCKRLDLYLRYESIVPEDVLAKLRTWVVRRANREPWQYIVGHAAFLDLELQVDPRVLIPRPETEELVMLLIEGATAAPQAIVDLGTGSGAIALALAKAYPEAVVVAVDKSQDALSVARHNAERLGLAARIHFLESNWFSALEGRFDWIVANPPYLTEDELLGAAPEVKEHEPKTALVALEEGRLDLEVILKGAMDYLNPAGIIALEMGIHHGEGLLRYAQGLGYGNCEVKNDLSGRARYFFAKKV